MQEQLKVLESRTGYHGIDPQSRPGEMVLVEDPEHRLRNISLSSVSDGGELSLWDRSAQLGSSPVLEVQIPDEPSDCEDSTTTSSLEELCATEQLVCGYCAQFVKNQDELK